MRVDVGTLALRMADLLETQAANGWTSYVSSDGTKVFLDGLFDMDVLAQQIIDSFKVETF